METPARNPEHEPARRRLLLLTLGSRHYPGPWSAPVLPPPCCPSLPASPLNLSAALVGFPHLFWSDPGDAKLPEAPRTTTPARSPGKVPTRRSPGATEGDRHFTWASAFSPAPASPSQPVPGGDPLLCSDLSSRPPTPEVNQPYLPVRFSLENT